LPIPNRICWKLIDRNLVQSKYVGHRLAIFQLCEAEMLTQQILPFLKTAAQCDQKVVVHCGGGIGRTGQILAAWLVYHHQYSQREAISTVRKMGRNPYEAAIFGLFWGRNPAASVRELHRLLDRARQ
jgi:protein-tyrosine phosphatase